MIDLRDFEVFPLCHRKMLLLKCVLLDKDGLRGLNIIAFYVRMSLILGNTQGVNG